MTREAAWRLLRSGSPRPLADVASVAAAADLDSRDRGLLRAIVGTCLRRRGTLRALTKAFARGKTNPDVAAHLHVGLAQIFFLDRVPDHAAVSETVRATADTVGLSKGRYVNGVLRSAIRARREGLSGDPCRDIFGRNLNVDALAFRNPDEHPYLWMEDVLNIPASLAKRWSQRHGADVARSLAQTFLVEPELSLRVVGRAGAEAREEVSRELTECECQPRPGRHPSVLLCPASDVEGVVSSTAFQSGRITVQGETALRAAELVGAAEGESILDLCAAPGGKTAVLAESGARVIASDRSEERLGDLRQTLERLGCAEHVEERVADGAAGLTETFDAVLVDAPCSNTGVLGARPSARWRFGPQELASLRDIQARLLTEGAERVRPGGRLVWSTCSLEPEENGQRIRAFLAEHTEFTLEEEHESLPALVDANADEQPSAGPIDGGYAARLVRSS